MSAVDKLSEENTDMVRVELIVCHDHGWDDGIFVDIPQHLHQMHDVDEVAQWVCDNHDNLIHKDAVYIGVYNWEVQPEDEEEKS